MRALTGTFRCGRAGFAVGARQYADFAVLWGRMPEQLVLPRLDAESVTTEQKVAIRRLQRGAEGRSVYVSSRPKKVKEHPVIAKTTEEVDGETIPYHGDRRLNRDLRGSTGRRRRIAVR